MNIPRINGFFNIGMMLWPMSNAPTMNKINPRIVTNGIIHNPTIRESGTKIIISSNGEISNIPIVKRIIPVLIITLKNDNAKNSEIPYEM
jgi:hypothetical protein